MSEKWLPGDMACQQRGDQVMYCKTALVDQSLWPDRKDRWLKALTAVSSSAHTRVYRGDIVGRAGQLSVYLKEFIDRGFTERVKQLVKPHRALRAARADSRLNRCGFTAPTLVAIGYRQRRLTRTGFFMITEALDDYQDLYQWCAHLAGLTVASRRQRLRALAIAVAQLHRAGFSHGDLRPGNVLAKQDAQGNWHWAYLDNERTQQHRRLPMKLRKKNLVQLNMLRSPNLTRRDRLFFFLCYGQHFPDIDQRKLLSRITNTTRQRLDRLVRRGRLSAEEAAL